MKQIELIELGEGNINDGECYCLRSKPTSTGYINKNKWLMGRLNEGLKYVKVMENSKPAGFIE